MKPSKKNKDFKNDFSRNYHILVTTSAWQFLPTDSQEELEGNTKKLERNLKDSLIKLHKNKDFGNDFSRNYHIQIITSAWKFPSIDSQEELERNTRTCKMNLKNSLMELFKNKDFGNNFSRYYHNQVTTSARKFRPIDCQEELQGNTKKCKRNLKHSLMELFKNKDFGHDLSRNYHNRFITSAWKFIPTDSQEELEVNTNKCGRNLKDSLMELHKNKDFGNDFSRNYHIQVITSVWKFPLIDYQEELGANMKNCKRTWKTAWNFPKIWRF